MTPQEKPQNSTAEQLVAGRADPTLDVLGYTELRSQHARAVAAQRIGNSLLNERGDSEDGYVPVDTAYLASRLQPDDSQAPRDAS